MLPKVQIKNTERKRYRGQVTSDEMDQFLSRPLSKIQNLNRSLRKSYESDFFKKQKFDELRAIRNKNQEDSLSDDNQSNDSVFTVHNDKRTRRRRERQKLLALQNNNEPVTTTNPKARKRKPKIAIEQPKTKAEEQQSKKKQVQSQSSDQSGQASGSPSESSSSNNNSSSSASSESESEYAPSQKDNEAIHEPSVQPTIIPQTQQISNQAKEANNEQHQQRVAEQRIQPYKIQEQEEEQSSPANHQQQAKSEVQQQHSTPPETKLKKQSTGNKKPLKRYPKINNLDSEDSPDKIQRKDEISEAPIQLKTRSKIKIGLTLSSGDATENQNNNADPQPTTHKRQTKTTNHTMPRNSRIKRQKPMNEDSEPQPTRKRAYEYHIEAKRKLHNLSYCSKVVLESVFMRVPHYFYAYSPRQAELFAAHGNRNATLNQNYLVSQDHQRSFPLGVFRKKKIVEMSELPEEEDEQNQKVQEQQNSSQKKIVERQKQQRKPISKEKPKKEFVDPKPTLDNKIKRVPRQLQLLLDSRPSTDRRYRSGNLQQPVKLQTTKQNDSSPIEESGERQLRQSGETSELKRKTSHNQQNSADKTKQKRKKNKKNKRKEDRQE